VNTSSSRRCVATRGRKARATVGPFGVLSRDIGQAGLLFGTGQISRIVACQRPCYPPGQRPTPRDCDQVIRLTGRHKRPYLGLNVVITIRCIQTRQWQAGHGLREFAAQLANGSARRLDRDMHLLARGDEHVCQVLHDGGFATPLGPSTVTNRPRWWLGQGRSFIVAPSRCVAPELFERQRPGVRQRRESHEQPCRDQYIIGCPMRRQAIR